MVKVTHKNRIKMEVVSKINKIKLVLHKHRNKKNCYGCGSGKNMLNNHEIRDTIERYKCFDRTGDIKNNYQKEECKGNAQTVDSDTYVSVFSTKTSVWSGFQISLHGSKQVKKFGSDLG